MFKKMILSVLLFATISLSAQTASVPDKHTLAMQHMMLKLVAVAPADFITIKGTEESKNGNAVFYKVNLTNIITDPAEMKEALASDFFGAMQTADDHIVVTPEGTIYLAKYTDDPEFSITDMVTMAFMGLTSIDKNAKAEKMPGSTEDQTIYILSYNNTVVGKLNCNSKSGSAALIIGIKK